VILSLRFFALCLSSIDQKTRANELGSNPNLKEYQPTLRELYTTVI